LLSARNADRRALISSGKYRNPFNQEEAERFLRETFVRVVNEEKQRLMAEVLQRYTAGEAEGDAKVFGAADNVLEAAGCLLGSMRVCLHLILHS
jgi:hypothetical protein